MENLDQDLLKNQESSQKAEELIIPQKRESKEKSPITPDANMDNIKSELEKLAEDHYLILHQTSGDTAKGITETSKYFSETGLAGTVLVNQDVDMILSTFKDLDTPIEKRKKSTHRGASSMVILAFPKNLISSAHKIEDKIDSILVDKMMENKIEKFGLPRNFIFGYYHNGVFFKSNDFKPEF